MYRLCILILSLALHDTLAKSIKQGPTLKLKLIGSNGGHSYFYDNVQRNRGAAEAYCVSFGMELAEISTLEKMTLLQSYHGEDSDFSDFYGYWTSGRDSGVPSQFVWDKSGTQMADNLVWGPITGPYSCVYYAHRKLEAISCGHTSRVICQS